MILTAKAIDALPKLATTTINVGSASNQEVIAGLREIAQQAGQLPDVIFGQEFGDRGSLKRDIIDLGYWMVDGTGKIGQGSTPVFFLKATMEKAPPWYILLIARSWGGRGAGPSWIKPKWINGGKPRHKITRRRIRASSEHWPASQQHPLRFRLAQQATRKLVRSYHWLSIQIFGGDMNTKAKQLRWLERTLRAVGWTSSDIEGGRLNTHHRNLYDMIWWHRTTRLIFIEHFTTDVGSDHLAKTAIFRIRPRVRAS